MHWPKHSFLNAFCLHDGPLRCSSPRCTCPKQNTEGSLKNLTAQTIRLAYRASQISQNSGPSFLWLRVDTDLCHYADLKEKTKTTMLRNVQPHPKSRIGGRAGNDLIKASPSVLPLTCRCLHLSKLPGSAVGTEPRTRVGISRALLFQQRKLFTLLCLTRCARVLLALPKMC